MTTESYVTHPFGRRWNLRGGTREVIRDREHGRWFADVLEFGPRVILADTWAFRETRPEEFAQLLARSYNTL